MAAPTTDLQIVHIPIDELHPDPKNPRKISAEELDRLTRSLREFGFLQPVIARHDDHIVVGGHQRLVAARRIGLKTVPVIFVDLSDPAPKNWSSDNLSPPGKYAEEEACAGADSAKSRSSEF